MDPTQIPSERELLTALVDLRAQNPALGIAKLHALLLAGHPGWTVSEKRTRKILQSEGLILGPSSEKNQARHNSDDTAVGADSPFPVSRLVEGLDVTKWTSKVEVKYFSPRKGKGLVAKERISEGEVVWKEDPFVLAPEWEIYDLQTSSAACAHCSTPLMGSSLNVACPASAPCTARFCNRLCLSRSAMTHPLLCPAQNPAVIPLLSLSRKTQWMALHALSRCTARILLEEQHDPAVFKSDWEFVRSLAQLGMEERAKGGWLGNAQPDRETWKKAYEYYVQAFHAPVKDTEKKRLTRVLKKSVSKEVVEWLFDYDAFLRGLGRMSLSKCSSDPYFGSSHSMFFQFASDLEAHGGLYTLHSHINHSCDPNISVRHLEQRTALARISVIARRDIKVGEELTVTYVNPQMGLYERRQGLLEWGFGQCKCARCVQEEQDPTRQTKDAVINGDRDLERELKAGLGVM